MNYNEVDVIKRRRKVTEYTPRRRLSAPETLMRKHQLAQERSSSQDSQQSDSDNSWHSDIPRASDSNLSKRRSCNQDIRKSTLMKRFWESSRGNLQSPSSFPSSFAEWQHGSYRQSKPGSSKSLLSLSESPKHTRGSGRRHFEMPKTDEDSYVVYSSTENTARTDASDSYPVSTSESVDTSLMATNMAVETKAYRINNTGISETNHTELPSLPIKYQFEINENGSEYEFIPKESQQTPCKMEENQATNKGKTNLNVITNVQLSQSTLNMIFNQVMQDVLHKPFNNPEILEDNITKQTAFNWKINLEDTKIEKTFNSQPESSKSEEEVPPKEDFISKINIGSPYRTRTSPSVLRLSALPRTTSMEVNISSNDSFDKDSDTSLVDSLDDPTSPRLKIKRQTNINITKETKTLEDSNDEVVEKEETKKVIKKSSVFYIPIDDSYSVKSESDSPQVSNLLPSKLKEKLLQRQLKREEKRLQDRMKAFDVENGNISEYFSTSPEISTNLSNGSRKTPRTYRKSPKKMTLPQIDLTKDYTKSSKASHTQRSLHKYREAESSKKSVLLPKSYAKQPQEEKTQSKSSTSTKHIEILEIMEIVEPERVKKSRIPVFQHSGIGSGTKLPKLKPKPTFLDFGEVGQPGDPKLDQLIANILIDTLNHEGLKDSIKKNTRPVVGSTSQDQQEKSYMNNNPRLIEQAADILTKQVLGNNNLDPDSPKLPQNVGNVELHDLKTEDIPKGWITFYMLQKTKSPESSTSDEGMKTGHTDKTTQCHQSDSDLNPVTDLRSRRKINLRRTSTNPSQPKPDGWSVTFSNNNDACEAAPEVEMKFKFPSLSSLKNNRTTTEKTERSSSLKFEDVCAEPSEIEISKKFLENPRNIKMRRRQIKLSPRATKTSRQRTLLNRQKHVPSYDKDDLPQVLSISGSGLHQIRRLPRLSENVLKRLLQNLHQEEIKTSKDPSAK